MTVYIGKGKQVHGATEVRPTPDYWHPTMLRTRCGMARSMQYFRSTPKPVTCKRCLKKMEKEVV